MLNKATARSAIEHRLRRGPCSPRKLQGLLWRHKEYFRQAYNEMLALDLIRETGSGDGRKVMLVNWRPSVPEVRHRLDICLRELGMPDRLIDPFVKSENPLHQLRIWLEMFYNVEERKKSIESKENEGGSNDLGF